ncbi:hypothetical protein PybrP1_005317 [[Pythium] brassicae (nom. inval.)]|nr:hypothetical protein PybrP1_005317 [[Pythium] brassicae (nom. inval.)]
MARKTTAAAVLAVPPLAVAALSFFAARAGALTSAALGCLAAFALCDAWYFARLASNAVAEALTARGLVQAKPRRALLAVGELPGRVLPGDIDRNGHCNNARFLRECGFARRDFWQRNGLWRVLTAHGGNLIVGSQNVRYRRELALGEAYALETRVRCWDARAFYVEHRFVTRRPGGGKPFVNAIVLVKNSVLGPLSPAQLVAALLPELDDKARASPSVPEDIAAWILSNDISSKMLRAESGL